MEGVWGQGARKSGARGIPHGAAALKGLWGTQKETGAGVRWLEVGGSRGAVPGQSTAPPSSLAEQGTQDAGRERGQGLAKKA